MGPPKGKRGRSKKGKKRRKKGKKKKTEAEPPPLHLLTELYKKLEDATRKLYEMRVATRKKRLEGWFMTREMLDIKSDNQLYNDYLNENIEGLQAAIENLLKLIQEERDAINKAIADLLEKLEKQRLEYEAKSAQIEQELADVRLLLLEFEPMMEELARLMAILEKLLAEIEAAKLAAIKKIRHLTNQFLDQRARLHNHLEEQLFLLIKHCRTYVMPILWNFMQGLIRENMCERWKLARTDEKNIMLAEKREELMSRRKVLALEKPYWNIEWAFFKLAEIDSRRNKRQAKVEAAKMLEEIRAEEEKQEQELLLEEAEKPGTPDSGVTRVSVITRRKSLKPKPGTGRPLDPDPNTQLGKDFNEFLINRLVAAREAAERNAIEAKIEERKLMKRILQKARAAKRKRKKRRRQRTLVRIPSNQMPRPSHVTEDGDFYKDLLDAQDWQDYDEDEDEEGRRHSMSSSRYDDDDGEEEEGFDGHKLKSMDSRTNMEQMGDEDTEEEEGD